MVKKLNTRLITITFFIVFLRAEHRYSVHQLKTYYFCRAIFDTFCLEKIDWL